MTILAIIGAMYLGATILVVLFFVATSRQSTAANKVTARHIAEKESGEGAILTYE